MPSFPDAALLDSGDHAVHFYDHERELADSVGAFLGRALRGGRVAISVATRSHLELFAAELRRAGLDVSELRASGRYHELDAEQTLRGFMVAGRPDRARFEATVGSAVRAAASAGPPAVYGEMVSLLWDAGMVAAAIELEELWNELAEETPFGLLCAYPSDALAAEESAVAAQELCRLHSHVISSPFCVEPPSALVPASTTRSFPADRRSPAGARHFVATTLLALGLEELVEDAALIVSEMATNAIVHARSGFTVALSRTPRSLRITVGDDAAARGAAERVSLAVRPGHGLAIVAALASRWDSETRAGRTVVWAELGR